jgi:opacity protein-like surface antigen
MTDPKILRFILLLFLAGPVSAISAPHALAQDRYDGVYDIISDLVHTDVIYSKDMNERQHDVTNKSIVQLNAIKDGRLKPYNFYIGGRFHGTYIAERTNTDGKFPILSRLPPTHTDKNSDSYGVVNDVTLHATAVFPWVTGFVQGEYSEIPYSGQDRHQIRKYWVTLGDLDEYPFYATIGKKTVNFGNFESYTPFTHTHSAHYFWAQTDEPLLEVGYVGEQGTMLAASLIKNDRGLRVLNSPKNDDKYENFAFNASHEFTMGEHRNKTHFKIGGGFLRGSIYDSALAHHPPAIGLNDRFWSSVINGNIEMNIKDFDFMVEYSQTLKDWPATDSKVRALTVQGRYRDTIMGKPATYSLAYSRGEQGNSADEWHQMQQAILGVEIELHPHLSIGGEYMVNDGFVHLILPRRTADDGVVSHTAIVGVKLSF